MLWSFIIFHGEYVDKSVAFARTNLNFPSATFVEIHAKQDFWGKNELVEARLCSRLD